MAAKPKSFKVLIPEVKYSQTVVRRLLKALIAALCLEVLLAAINLIFPPDMTRAQHASAVALDRHGAWLRALPTENGRWRIRADLKRTDPEFIKTLLSVEDERFYLHSGVDAPALIRAVGSNMGAGHVVSGASTLTMQTARLLEPKPRNMASKLIEALRAWQLELRYQKSDILSFYLTLTPYGGNLEGVRAASLSYLGHEPETLTLSEQALLIALPQSPEARRPDRHPKAAKAARDLVLSRLLAARRISGQQASEAMAEALPATRQDFPALAWHTAGKLAARAQGLEATVITTIDAGLQQKLETLAERTARAQGENSSVAILVVDINTRAVRAAIGSGGLYRPGGWVNMLDAVRSPGSALKPFIYGMGFEAGVIAPDTRLMDAPTRFGDYQPEDFDKVFHGEVSAKEALINSLNVPAVAVLNKLGSEGFEAKLEGSGIKLYRPKAGLKDAGLALALGGLGIRLDDLAKLYAGLGDGGLIKPLNYTEAEAGRSGFAPGARLMSQTAADKVLAILRETPAPAGRLPSHLMRSGNRPAYKTGTSYSFRDALAVGVAGGYAVMVWTGRPDGGARADMTGREASAPLLFDVFDQINTASQAPNRITPARAPEALKTLAGARTGPSILFPPQGATLFVESAPVGKDGALKVTRGLKLSARGKGPLGWYINEKPLPLNTEADADATPIWFPEAEGFYKVTVVDAEGQHNSVNVRVRAVGANAQP